MNLTKLAPDTLASLQLGKVNQDGNLIEVSALVDRVNHPFAPTVEEVLSADYESRSLKLEIGRRGQSNLVFETKDGMMAFLKAAHQNQKQGGGAWRGQGLLKNSQVIEMDRIKPSKLNAEFVERRSAEHHFGEGASW